MSLLSFLSKHTHLNVRLVCKTKELQVTGKGGGGGVGIQWESIAFNYFTHAIENTVANTINVT